MNHNEIIKELERQTQTEENKIKAMLQAGKVPTKDDYSELDKIKRELKTARRVKSLDEKRVDPKLTRKVSILLSDDEYRELVKNAINKGVDLSKHIRQLLKLNGKVEGNPHLKT